MINKILPNDVYRVADMTVKEGCQYVTIVHASHLKGYQIGPDHDEVPEHISDDLEEKSEELKKTEEKTDEPQKTEKTSMQSFSRVKTNPEWSRTSYNMILLNLLNLLIHSIKFCIHIVKSS